MKKFISFALIAALVATSAFAAFSGDATVSFGYDTDSKVWGFANDDSTTLKVQLAADTAEKVGEGDIYAGIKASFEVLVANKEADGNGVSMNNDKLAVGANVSVDEAYVTNGEWKVSILGAVDAPSYAKSFVTKKPATNNVKDAFGNKYKKEAKAIDLFKIAPSTALQGVTVTYDGYKVGVGLEAVGTDSLGFTAFVETKSFDLEGAKVQAAAFAAKANAADSKVGAGASVKADVDVDDLCITAAVDAGLSAEKFGVDATVGVKYDFVSADAYAYFYDDANRVDAKAALDLASFEVPVKLTVTGKDLTNDVDGQDLSAKVEATVSAEVSCDATVGYVLSNKKISASANVKYAPEAFTAKAGVSFSKVLDTDNTTVVAATASVETTKLVNGATLSLAYGPRSVAGNDVDMNFLADQATAQEFGKVTAACKIAF